MSGTVTLILGGARSGKSRWAEHLATQTGRRVLYIATARASDAEMAERIAAHRANRPAGWQTVEVFDNLVAAVRDAAPVADVVIVDCLTLWVSNVIFQRTARLGDADAVAPEEWRAIQDDLVREAQRLVDQVRESEQTVILVSNEVGLGLVPPFPLGRYYRDILGAINQTIARDADSVVLMIAGLPLDLRRLPLNQDLPG
ncbi:MAG TPA: bifunctional adenosylcobinamide kinase/adenosylcobinamide-phosphate guanylyltransferase [Chloroflexota bacterium]|nr:bifunctional adenosylcobinamide kinase/adenosylcobinamide-phosphate guanylyltransferase [Chloroflexota bacterium]